MSGSFPEPDLDTGDIILVKGDSFFSRLIECCTFSRYSHVAMILKNPTYINPQWTGLYVIESTISMADDSSEICGVVVRPWADFVSDKSIKGQTIWARKIQGFNCNVHQRETLKSLYESCKYVPYDFLLGDWLRALEVSWYPTIEGYLTTHQPPKDKIQNDREMDCSALCGFIYTQLGILQHVEPWTLLAPRDFCEEREDLEWNSGFSLGNQTQLY